MQDIRSFLSPRHRVGVVCISGGGGIGKTALALEVAHTCYEESASQPPEERFEAIIWATAKNVELLPGGLANRQRQPLATSTAFTVPLPICSTCL